MMRELISDLLSQRIREIVPVIVGDEWGNTAITVLYKNVEATDNGVFNDNEGFFNGLMALSGRLDVMLFTDAKTPIDPLPLFIHLYKSPLIIEPDQNIPAGSFALQLRFKPNKLSDQFYEERVIPVMSADIDFCDAIIFERTPYLATVVGEQISVARED